MSSWVVQIILASNLVPCLLVIGDNSEGDKAVLTLIEISPSSQQTFTFEKDINNDLTIYFGKKSNVFLKMSYLNFKGKEEEIIMKCNNTNDRDEIYAKFSSVVYHVNPTPNIDCSLLVEVTKVDFYFI